MCDTLSFLSVIAIEFHIRIRHAAQNPHRMTDQSTQQQQIQKQQQQKCNLHQHKQVARRKRC